MFKKLAFILLLLSVYSSEVIAQVQLPRLISDGMIIQRDANVNIWGRADPGKRISVQFLDNEYEAIANENGEWSVLMRNLPAGGPHTLTITSSETITISDVYIGDVWVASGQSNMELPMRRVAPLYREELVTADNPEIRFFGL
jgi:sialate O-acetylesterase